MKLNPEHTPFVATFLWIAGWIALLLGGLFVLGALAGPAVMAGIGILTGVVLEIGAFLLFGLGTAVDRLARIEIYLRPAKDYLAQRRD